MAKVPQALHHKLPSKQQDGSPQPSKIPEKCACANAVSWPGIHIVMAEYRLCFRSPLSKDVVDSLGATRV